MESTEESYSQDQMKSSQEREFKVGTIEMITIDGHPVLVMKDVELAPDTGHEVFGIKPGDLVPKFDYYDLAPGEIPQEFARFPIMADRGTGIISHVIAEYHGGISEQNDQMQGFMTALFTKVHEGNRVLREQFLENVKGSDKKFAFIYGHGDAQWKKDGFLPKRQFVAGESDGSSVVRVDKVLNQIGVANNEELYSAIALVACNDANLTPKTVLKNTPIYYVQGETGEYSTNARTRVLNANE